MDTGTSNRITMMKLLCSFMVVCVHSQFIGDGYANMWLREFVMYGMCRVAVPFFFIVSGFFLSKHFYEEHWWWTELGKRVSGLLLPCIFWNCLFVLVTYLISIFQGRLDLTPIAMLKDYGLDPRTPPLLVPLWYIRALFVLILISPGVFYFVCRRRNVGVMWLLSIGLVCFLFRPYSDCAHNFWYYLFNYGFSLEGLLYFSIGAYLRYFPLKEPGKVVGFACLVLGIMLFALRAWLLIHKQFLWQSSQVGFFAIPCLLFGIFSMLPSLELSRILKGASFPIYVCHLFFLAGIGGRISRGGDWHVCVPTMEMWPLRVLFAILMPVLLSMILDRYWPAASKFAFGGRSKGLRGKDVSQ